MGEEQVVYETWKEMLVIPNWMIIDITDAGMEEQYGDGVFIDSDDLHVAITILGCHKILLPGNSRIVLRNNGDLSIQMLKPNERG